MNHERSGEIDYNSVFMPKSFRFSQVLSFVGDDTIDRNQSTQTSELAFSRSSQKNNTDT
jgi:hypothetical protein